MGGGGAGAGGSGQAGDRLRPGGRRGKGEQELTFLPGPTAS